MAEVKQQIQQTEKEVKQQQKQLEQAEKKLQQSDKALAEASASVRETEQQRQQLITREQQLLKQKTELEQSLQQQQKLLASQLKSAYSLGQHDYSRMLLNQQDAGKLERVLSYYQYFNRARMQQLAELNNTISQLQQVLSELSDKQQQLAQTLAILQQQQQQLLGAKTEQQQAVGRLQAMLKQQGRQLDYLRQNEASLQSKLEELRRLAQQARELAGLTKDKGKLSWPLQGSLLQRFGESRQGGISSRGILIQSTEGQAVKAVADGQVIYADWLKGYGWVIVLDHGAGFMSLYGHNQNLLKKPGTRISAGETIALAGTSGGQSAAGLYFEIRNKGEAVNPLQWLSRN
ncbi:murein hydrolase activator EnvC family protein [Rheinheimera oceanensis]|uniref:murein hydrolase activator EnvC family protein n=1 Tax=Rheinheimera oceanensis TaxID=2817449 RepID=UPI00203FF20B|nr:peptidoglycan DD-metalloendopeptidase family protein [Rheinheimera oceanensis]